MIRVWPGRFCAALTISLVTFALRADVLLSPDANQLRGPFFVQPFSFVTIDSVTSGGQYCQTSAFFSSLPPGSYPSLQVVNVLGNFLAFDSMGNPVTDFDIDGVSVTTGGNTFTPAFGLFNFAGNPSVTFTDALNPLNTATFLNTDFTFAFTFVSDPSLTYSYTLVTSGLDAGSTVVFDDVEATTPEPGFTWLLVSAIVIIGQRSRARRKRN